MEDKICLYDLLLMAVIHAQIVKEQEDKVFDSLVGSAKAAGITIEELRARRTIDQVNAIMKRLDWGD